MSERVIITIDGPAGSGKSTTARLVAKRLGFLYIDSGAIYRAFTLAALRNQVPVTHEDGLAQLLKKINIRVENSSNGNLIFLDGQEVTHEIRSREVAAKVSRVSEHSKVRAVITQKIRELAKKQSAVIEGRDIGTVVFPNADLKFFMKASLEERAKRRLKEYELKGISEQLERVKEEMAKRDGIDSTRQLSPLKPANDAISVDTTRLSIEQQVEVVLQEYRNRILQ